MNKNANIIKKYPSEVGNVGYGSTGCGVFKWGIQKQKDFCLRINLTKENY